MVEVYSSSKVYIASPSKHYTGGPNLLHQLCHALRNIMEIDAYMYYTDIDTAKEVNKIHPYYRKYNNPIASYIEDTDRNILIVPEVKDGIKILAQYAEIRKIIWWLSIDNFYASFFINKPYMIFIRLLNKLYKIYKKTRLNLIDVNKKLMKKYTIQNLPEAYFLEIKRVDYHFVQSVYAFNHLRFLGFPIEKIYYLSDYIDEEFLNIKYNARQKEDIVVYNPSKESSFTRKLITYSERLKYKIKFVPIYKMTRQEAIELLLKAKVYIDFGNHPGKDRIPREAAVLGCCVITGKRGSAAYYEDVPIPKEYKFDDIEENIPLILEKIKDCMQNYKDKIDHFDNYRQIIKNEKQKFLADLGNIFVKV